MKMLQVNQWTALAACALAVAGCQNEENSAAQQAQPQPAVATQPPAIGPAPASTPTGPTVPASNDSMPGGQMPSAGNEGTAGGPGPMDAMMMSMDDPAEETGSIVQAESDSGNWPRQALPLADPEVQACVQRGMSFGTPERCAECTCQYCKPEADRVYLADGALAQRAQALISCGLEECCTATSCYCQLTPDGSMVDLGGCAATAEGPCVDKVHTAAGVEGLVSVQAPCETIRSNPCFWARELGMCTTGNPTPLSTNPVVGHCTEECQMCMPPGGVGAADSGMGMDMPDAGMGMGTGM